MTDVISPTTVEDRLDLLSRQVAAVAEDLRKQRESREQWQELAQTLVPVSQDAFELASRELDDLSRDVTVDDAVRFSRTMARSLPRLETMLRQLDSLAELGAELTSLSGAGVGRLSELLAGAERDGWFDLVPVLADAAGALRQPPADPPSALALVKSLRDPRTRRGLATLLLVLQALGQERPSRSSSAPLHERG